MGRTRTRVHGSWSASTADISACCCEQAHPEAKRHGENVEVRDRPGDV
jgi:hypothetical protein